MEDCTARRDRVLLEEVLRDKEGVRKKRVIKEMREVRRGGEENRKRNRARLGAGWRKINGLTSLLSLFTHPRSSDPSICTRGGPNANRSFLGQSTGSEKRPPKRGLRTSSGAVMLTGVPPPNSLPGAGRESSGQVRCSL